MRVQKKARDLRVGDNIIGLTTSWLVENVQKSPLCGVSFPLITVIDSNGKQFDIETGGTEKFQDHVYDVETSSVPVAPVEPKPVKKAVKKPVTKKKK
jgi:hypothetical protein